MIRSLIVATAVALGACSQAGAEKIDTAATSAPSVPQTAAMTAYSAKATEYFSGGPAVTPAEVLSMITAQGARPTVTALDPNGGKTRWTSAMAGIARGEPPGWRSPRPWSPVRKTRPTTT